MSNRNQPGRKVQPQNDALSKLAAAGQKPVEHEGGSPIDSFNVRSTRAEDSRGGDVRVARPNFFQPSQRLPYVPPQDGNVQMWVRISIHGQADPGNVMNHMSQGWRPRPADTLPQGFFVPSYDHPSLGNVIGTHDCVLMERPKALAEEHAAEIRRQAGLQMQAVRSNLYREGSGDRGFGSPTMTNRSEVDRELTGGRMPPVQSDDINSDVGDDL